MRRCSPETLRRLRCRKAFIPQIRSWGRQPTTMLRWCEGSRIRHFNKKINHWFKLFNILRPWKTRDHTGDRTSPSRVECRGRLQLIRHQLSGWTFTRGAVSQMHSGSKVRLQSGWREQTGWTTSRLPGFRGELTAALKHDTDRFKL